jgi:hypothetical protein
MPSLWSPTTILQLCNDSRCVGHAPSKSRKCLARIRKANVQRCTSIIADMAQQTPDAVLLAPQLRLLAECGLCVRWHQYQIDAMVGKWSERMRAAFPAAQVGPQVIPAPVPSTTRARTVSPTPPHTVRTPASVPGPSRTVPVPRCHRTHVRRLPTDEECSICCDEVVMSEGDGTLVWCKSGCGKSVHKECFEVWRQSCVRARKAATCVYCRGKWKDTCGC